MAKYTKAITKISSRKDAEDVSVRIVSSYNSLDDYIQKCAGDVIELFPENKLVNKLKKLPGFIYNYDEDAFGVLSTTDEHVTVQWNFWHNPSKIYFADISIIYTENDDKMSKPVSSIFVKTWSDNDGDRLFDILKKFVYSDSFQDVLIKAPEIMRRKIGDTTNIVELPLQDDEPRKIYDEDAEVIPFPDKNAAFGGTRKIVRPGDPTEQRGGAPVELEEMSGEEVSDVGFDEENLSKILSGEDIAPVDIIRYFLFKHYKKPQYKDYNSGMLSKLFEVQPSKFFDLELFNDPEFQSETRRAAFHTAVLEPHYFFDTVLPNFTDVASGYTNLADKSLAEIKDPGTRRHELLYGKKSEISKPTGISKRSGRLGYPKKMLEEIYNWAVEAAPELKHGWFKKPSKTRVNKVFKIDLSDTEQLRKRPELFGILKMFQDSGWHEILSVTMFPEDPKGIDGSYDSVVAGTHSINIYDPNLLIKENDLKRTIMHELTHMVQDIMRSLALKGDIRGAGLPGKYDIEAYKMYGRPKDLDKGEPTKWHSVSQIEFFPILNEEIHGMIDYVKKSKDKEKAFYKYLNKSSRLIRYLKEHNKDYYEKALREFYRAFDAIKSEASKTNILSKRANIPEPLPEDDTPSVEPVAEREATELEKKYKDLIEKYKKIDFDDYEFNPMDPVFDETFDIRKPEPFDVIRYFMFNHYKRQKYKPYNNQMLELLFKVRPSKFFDSNLFSEKEFAPHTEQAIEASARLEPQYFIDTLAWIIPRDVANKYLDLAKKNLKDGESLEDRRERLLHTKLSKRDFELSKRASAVKLDEQTVAAFKRVLLNYIKELIGDSEEFTDEEINKDVAFMMAKVDQENKRAIELLTNAIGRIKGWNGTPVIVKMRWSDPDDMMSARFWDNLMDPDRNIKLSHSVYLGPADFTMFFDGTVDDILEVGIEQYEPDFFVSPEQKGDYYSLLNSLQNKGVTETKELVLYTGRPVKDREQLKELAGQKKWPTGIWLTDDINLAYSFGADYGEARDVWRVHVSSQNVMHDPSGSVGRNNYQLYGPGNLVDIASARIVAEGQKPLAARKLNISKRATEKDDTFISHLDPEKKYVSEEEGFMRDVETGEREPAYLDDAACPDCGSSMPLDVYKSAAGYYIGRFCNQCGPYSRESGYFRTKQDAQVELDMYKTFSEEPEPEWAKETDISKRAKDPLSTYKKKRDFDETPEPKSGGKGENIFVIHDHYASHHHFDLRLQHKSVLESWAVPKAKLPSKGEKLLATHVEPHPLSYTGSYNIPKEEYGGGKVSVYQKGNYRPISWSSKKIEFEILSGKAKGKYVLIHTGGKKWLWMAAGDEEKDSK